MLTNEPARFVPPADGDTALVLSPCPGNRCPCHDGGRSGRRFPSHADPAQRLLLNCHRFILCASSELALINPAGQKAAAQGWAISSSVVAKTSPSTPEPVSGVGSINGTQKFQPGFQSKQRGVGSHPHDSQHCCRSPFWKKCEIYCNTC